MLANILHGSGITEDETIEKIFGITSFDNFTFEKPSSSPKLEERELGRLAMEIEPQTMHKKAVTRWAFQKSKCRTYLPTLAPTGGALLLKCWSSGGIEATVVR